MGLELTQLAQRGACGVVLLVSDDERLIPYIDEAQWRGLKVVLVSDENSLDVPKLMEKTRAGHVCCCKPTAVLRLPMPRGPH